MVYVFLIFFFVSLVWMLSLGVAKFTSLHMTNTNKETNKWEIERKAELRKENKSGCLSLLEEIYIMYFFP